LSVWADRHHFDRVNVVLHISRVPRKFSVQPQRVNLYRLTRNHVPLCCAGLKLDTRETGAAGTRLTGAVSSRDGTLNEAASCTPRYTNRDVKKPMIPNTTYTHSFVTWFKTTSRAQKMAATAAHLTFNATSQTTINHNSDRQTNPNRSTDPNLPNHKPQPQPPHHHAPNDQPYCHTATPQAPHPGATTIHAATPFHRHNNTPQILQNGSQHPRAA
jgi:hypothetical protein